MTIDLKTELLDKMETRFYGKYRAFVADNADPENRGRLRLRIPSVLGGDIISGWALPCAPYGGTAGQGFFYIPDKDAGVWAEFEEGKLDFPVWVGTFWAKPGGTTEVPDPASSQSPPTSKIIKTSKHTIELADKDNGEAITITDTTNNNVLTLNSKGITIKDQNNNQITLEKGDLKLASDKKIMIGAGAGSDHLVLGDTLQKLLDPWFQAIATHVHVGNLGAPTSPAASLPAAVPQLTSALSKKHVVE